MYVCMYVCIYIYIHIYTKSKECLKVAKISLGPLYTIHFKIAGLVRRFSWRRTMSSSRMHYFSVSSVHFSSLVMSNSLRLHRLQHARPPCPSSTPRIYTNSYSLSWWCHPTMSSSVNPFSKLQSFPASGSFPMNQLFAWGDQSIGVSASASVLPMNTQDWSL